MDEKWAEQLRQKLYHHEEAVPDDLWHRIEAGMEQKDGISAPEPHRLHPLAKISVYIGTIAACLTVCYLIWPKEEFTQIIAKQEILQNPQITQPAPEIPEDIPFSASVSADKKQKNELTAYTKKTNETDVPPPSATDIKQSPEFSENEKTKEKSNTGNIPELEHIKLPEHSKRQNGTQPAKNYSIAEKRNPVNYTLSLAGVQSMPSSKTSYQGMGNINAGKLQTTSIDGSQWGESNFSDILLYNRKGNPETDIKHYQPVTAAVKLQIRLNEYWSLETGVSYTLLRSDLRSGGDSYFYKTEQRIHLLGIPLKVNYSIWRNKFWNLYAHAGMLFEKDIHANASTEYFKEGIAVENKNEHLHLHGLQYTAQAGAGIQYNLTNRFSIYAEPGISGHIVPDKSIKTIYTDKPVNFNLELGLRLNW